jgi:anaphase-promoting complex subunit 2
MLKDMADSKRIDDNVHGDIKASSGIICTSSCVLILTCSPMCILWSSLACSGLTSDRHRSILLPCSQRKCFSVTTCDDSVQAEYETAFHRLKPDKHLRWIQHLGTAVVKLELEDRIVEVEATPLQASIAELFSERPEWQVKEIAERLSVGDSGSLRNALAFWANEGVVKEDGGVWKILEVAEDVAAPGKLFSSTQSYFCSKSNGSPMNEIELNM